MANQNTPPLDLDAYRAPVTPPLNLEDYKVIQEASTKADPELERELEAYRVYKENMRRFKTLEELVEFSRHNFVFYPDDFGMRLQQVIETEEQFVNFLQRCCMLNHEIGDNPWLMWIVNEYSSVLEEYLSPTDQLIARRSEKIGSDSDEDVWYSDGEEPEYGPDQTIEAWCAEYNPYEDLRFSVHKTQTKVFLPGDFQVKDRYKEKMPFIARFVSHNTWDRLGSIKGQDLDIIPLADLQKDAISIH